MKRILWIVLAWLVLMATGQAASFDCEKASTAIEKMICGNDELSKLDEELNRAYKSALQDNRNAKTIQQDQKQWMKGRNNCQDSSCIKRAYEDRLSSVRRTIAAVDPTIGKQLLCQKSTDLSVPYDFYVGVAPNRQTFAQPISSTFGLSKTAIPLADWPSTVEAARLCDGGIVAVRLPESAAHFQTLLTARIYDEKFSPRTEEFRVTESDEAQWEHSVSSLYDGNFVVTWKTYAEKRKSGGIKIRARIFSAQGIPLTKSFDVSASPGNHYRANAYGLANGDFIVLWVLQGNGVRFRIFDNTGIPKTPETPVTQGEMAPYGYASKTGGFNVFLKGSTTYAYGKPQFDSPFSLARSYDERGVPLTNVLEGESISTFEGYQPSVERVVTDFANALELTLRKYREKDVMGFMFCDHPSAFVQMASQIKEWSKSSAIRNFATEYCEQTRSDCTQDQFTEKELVECLKN